MRPLASTDAQPNRLVGMSGPLVHLPVLISNILTEA
eukprot:CAMPEP_0116858618 /NCGR_PEP_ID=MMETSP0418-20121206/21284_1 /TAXON_ID=1158023 /ORGANISM="Astrosyne radiata, Strain 13vi08-1A" /LENGTH=35 /DNA_ID= /DNA_START= /DNA_END= /DNA_ORIENTATION=